MLRGCGARAYSARRCRGPRRPYAGASHRHARGHRQRLRVPVPRTSRATSPARSSASTAGATPERSAFPRKRPPLSEHRRAQASSPPWGCVPEPSRRDESDHDPIPRKRRPPSEHGCGVCPRTESRRKRPRSDSAEAPTRRANTSVGCLPEPSSRRTQATAQSGFRRDSALRSTHGLRRAEQTALPTVRLLPDSSRLGFWSAPSSWPGTPGRFRGSAEAPNSQPLANWSRRARLASFPASVRGRSCAKNQRRGTL